MISRLIQLFRRRPDACQLTLAALLVFLALPAAGQNGPRSAIRLRGCGPGGCEPTPRPICSPRAVLPKLAREIRVSGAVSFWATISEQGTVDELKLIRGHILLVEAALEAGKRYRYEPLIQNGKPVAFQTVITIVFALNAEAEQPGCKPQMNSEQARPTLPR